MSFLFVARAVFFFLLAAVAFLTLTPNPDDVEASLDFGRWIAQSLFGDASLGDKVGHFLAYAALGAAAALAQIRIARSGRWTILALMLYGAALEGVQGLGGVRDASVIDGLADGLGALAGYPACALLVAYSRSKAGA